ncbi:hypothetical protein [Mucilaginibacter defluvii]|uniref:Fimbrillin-A associated anchor protein Mfa1/Mfa2 n=1 Tax=Mucilaginibacter defluvii TaxID=1196019 RepID=A0ABP9FQX6_9SPHI
MKKVYLVFSLLILLFASCKKDSKSPSKPDSDTDGKKYEVNFNIGIDADEQNLQSSSKSKKITSNADLSTMATFLAYYVFNSDDKLVTSLIQTSTTPNFGKITDGFAAGTYTVVLVATKNKPTEYDSKHIVAWGSDIFYQKFELTVTASTVTQNINLQRVNGQLEVKLLDAIDDETLSIQYSLENDYSLLLNNGTPDISKPYPRGETKNIAPALFGTTNYTYKTYVTNTVKPMKVRVTVSNKIFGTYGKVIDSVMIYPNTRTVLSGNVFKGAYGEQGFTVTYNELYGSDTTVVEY